MAMQTQTVYGNLIRPGAYNQAVVQQGATGFSANGIIALVGEADQGPRFSVETDIEATAKFGPDQLGAVQAKYGSGSLVDAFRAAAKPSLDPEIPGAPSRFIFIKTNASVQASSTLASYTGTYATIKAKNYGKTGNLISYSVAANTAEAVPTTGNFSYVPNAGTVNYSIVANGATIAGTSTLTANTTPTAFVSALDSLTGIAATGGVNRNVLTVSGTLLVTANPGGTAGVDVIDVTRSIAWAVQPVAGDTLVIPITAPTPSPIAGAAGDLNKNVGAYVVTASTPTTLRAVKLSDAGAVAPSPGTVTHPVSITPAVNITAVTDLIVYSPVTVSLESGDPVDGIGKSLEIAQLATGTDLLERMAFVLGTTGAVTWVSKTGAAKLIVSASEYKATLSASRQLDQRSESMTAGGEIAIKIGYTGATTATVTVTDLALTTTIDAVAGLNLTLRDYPTLNDLAAYINAQSGYSCAVGTATLGQLPSTTLDNVTAQGILSTFGEKNGRIKIDGYRFFQKVASSSSLVQINDAVQADSGLPKVTTATAYLANGARGASTTADFTAGIDALARITCNFVVPCVSRNSADDIADGLTDVTSNYDIDSINAYARTHVNAMSEFKRRRNRQAIVSKNTSFTEAQTAASNMASYRVAMTFQDTKQTTSNGTIGQFQSYMAAALAAGCQAAGLYKSIFGKIINTSGVLMADGSFDDRDDTQVEDALLAGLLPMGRIESGGFEFISDQTTYGQDDATGTLNSIQGVYTMDVITMTLAQRIERRFKGKSVADVGATAVVQAIESVMEDFLSKKLIAPSSDAPRGYRGITVSIVGPTCTISVEVKRAGCLYFFPITTYISAVTQTA
jgi:hypothetical protein